MTGGPLFRAWNISQIHIKMLFGIGERKTGGIIESSNISSGLLSDWIMFDKKYVAVRGLDGVGPNFGFEVAKKSV